MVQQLYLTALMAMFSVSAAFADISIDFESKAPVNLTGGRLTTQAGEIIAGKVSAVGDSLTSDKEWFEFMKTHDGVMAPGYKYDISITYKVVKAEKDAQFYFLCRSSSKGWGKFDRGWKATKGIAKQIDQVKTVTHKVGIANLMDYSLLIGIKGKAKILVDNIEIKRAEAYEEATSDEALLKRIPETAKSFKTYTFENGSAGVELNQAHGSFKRGKLIGDSTSSNQVWHVFAKTKGKLFKPDYRYFFLVKYKVIELAPKASFYGLMRSTKKGGKDLFLKTFKLAPGGNGLFFAESRVYFPDENYTFQLGIKGKGKIEVSSIEIREEEGKPNVALANRPAFDKSKATLVFSDEFNGTVIDTKKWKISGDHARRGGMWRKKNTKLDGEGNLVLEFSKSEGKWDSGAMTSKQKFTYGYYEARVKLNDHPGHWFGFWLMDGAVNRVGNVGRDGTEIDIVESPWRGKDEVSHALHWDGYGEDHMSIGYHTKVPNLEEGYHTFAVDWFEHGYVFYVNGKETWRTYAGDVCQVPLSILFSDELGGWSGKATEAAIGDKTLVDWVRVYQYK